MTAAWMPRLPAADEPACWSWPVPPLRDVEAEVTAAAERCSLGVDVLRMMYADDPQWLRWAEFHAGARIAEAPEAAQRCAICGVASSWPTVKLVNDHCHATGQIRGRLCGRCNTREGRGGGGPAVARYRRVHPALILDAHEMYSGFHWVDGWNLREPGGDLRTPRPPTEWPTLPTGDQDVRRWGLDGDPQ